MLHISIAAESVFNILGFPITNSLLTTWLVMALLIIGSLLISGNLKHKPGQLQVAVELIIGGLFSFFTNLGGKHGKVFAPIAVTIFLFVIVSNWLGLIPGVGTIGFHEEGSKFTPLFRAPTADLNTTLALGLIAFVLMQYFGFKYVGPGYIKKFINISNPINFFVGILETVSDISKIISFAFRLFGNIFAGEVLLGVMGFLFAFFLPIPFYGLELFVGLIQALVFAMLTTVFINLAVSHEHEAHEEVRS